MNDQEIEQVIQERGLTSARITPEQLEGLIVREDYFTAADGVSGSLMASCHVAPPSWMEKVTICVILVKNGCRFVGVNEGPVSDANFDAELGRKLARQKAIDQIWPVLGYELRSRLTGT